MRVTIISSGFLFLAMSYSCNKDEMIDSREPDLLVVDRVEISGKPYNEYLYESDNLLVEESGRLNFITHRYNEKGQLVSTDYFSDDAFLSSDPKIFESALNRPELLDKSNSEIKSTLTYTYNSSGELVSSVFSRPEGGFSENSAFSYDINGRIARQTLYWENKATGYINYQYDQRGNLTRMTLYSLSSSGVAELSTTTQYEYDNNKNPFKVFYKLMIPGINTNSNNIVKETYTIHFKEGQGTDIVQVTLTSYIYNIYGYPVKKNNTIGYIYE